MFSFYFCQDEIEQEKCNSDTICYYQVVAVQPFLPMHDNKGSANILEANFDIGISMLYFCLFHLTKVVDHFVFETPFTQQGKTQTEDLAEQVCMQLYVTVRMYVHITNHLSRCVQLSVQKKNCVSNGKIFSICTKMLGGDQQN